MRNFKKSLRKEISSGEVDGLLFDLGVSSPQLDEAGRGFSFLRDGPLDMRMDPDAGVSAAEWLATVEESTLTRVLKTYGEEGMARRIARAILAVCAQARRSRQRCSWLDIVAGAAPARGQKKHPATKTFQAIRIFINSELDQLASALQQSVNVLRKATARRSGGRLCVISFHSLEDRIVKRFMRDASREPEQYRGMPSIPEAYRPKLKPIGKARRSNC